ncbi:conserved Plasmodium protein, unknown function [Plasmodium sp. gorilla clade G2]|uniref:conserved Plasmodium protein, unknown function n=1 Tax=Plasmodium sp. gorilla clade G2 TaxID=880535 RepID=UPI000D21DE15|nr:conserved Plasmodium protein, unknown function [Plasmodium sp. gorilla clade G2]SOV16082.1 conserved Plasmodium protein, unknown function [Plasmodium sp. gorilla clade G2]
MHDLIVYPYEKQNEYLYDQRDNLINEDHIKYVENEELDKNDISYKINIVSNSNNNNDNDNNNNNNISFQSNNSCINSDVFENTKNDNHQKREDITHLKKNSLDFNNLNENIFNINIEMKESNIKTTNDKHINDNNNNNNNNIISLRKNSKDTSTHTYTSDDSSYSSIDDIKHILKKKKIKNLQENKKKYICNYISQHKKRIKEKNCNLIQKKKINKQDNYLNTNLLKINRKTKENIKRASAASIILENNFDTDHMDEDEENSLSDENTYYHTNDF